MRLQNVSTFFSTCRNAVVACEVYATPAFMDY